MDQDVPLADFARAPRNGRAEPSTRWKAAGLTLLVYAGMAALALLPPPLPPQVMVLETSAILLPDPPRKDSARPPAPYLAPLIKPRAVSLSPPSFTVAAAAVPTPAPITAHITPISPLLGGVTDGISGSSGSANGRSGNDDASSGCFDAVWARAVTDRIGHYYRYPRSAHGATGIVMMQFTVRRSGRLDMLQIGKSSGNARLDDVAFEMVRHAVPLPRIPDRMHTQAITVELPIDFGVEGATFHPSSGTCQ
jgi:protein TonB